LDAVDFIVCPTVGVRAGRLNELTGPEAITRLTGQYLTLNRAFSLLGLPSLSVPVGLDRNRIPVGLQIVGGPFGDEAVILLASQIAVARQAQRDR
jgi:aspartyl-tRNA(Asn)/glutamyl-tRNA(Gln) amidotransferase subunit A